MGDAQSAPGVVTSGSLGLPAVCRALAEVRLAEHLEDHVRRVVDAAPPLTAEQRDKLALLLREPSFDQLTPLPASTPTKTGGKANVPTVRGHNPCPAVAGP